MFPTKFVDQVGLMNSQKKVCPVCVEWISMPCDELI